MPPILFYIYSAAFFGIVASPVSLLLHHFVGCADKYNYDGVQFHFTLFVDALSSALMLLSATWVLSQTIDIKATLWKNHSTKSVTYLMVHPYLRAVLALLSSVFLWALWIRGMASLIGWHVASEDIWLPFRNSLAIAGGLALALAVAILYLAVTLWLLPTMHCDVSLILVAPLAMLLVILAIVAMAVINDEHTNCMVISLLSSLKPPVKG